MRKPLLLTLSLLVLAMMPMCILAQKTNVIIIMPDDLSYSDYSYYNQSESSPQTPHIDQLVGESVRLNDFHVAPTCSPSRSQLMTGRDDNEVGVWHTVMGRYFMNKDEVTMADVFKANGYRTALFGKWHLGESYPFRPKDRGFERVDMIQGGGIEQQPAPWGIRNTAPSIVFNDDKPVMLTDENANLPGAAKHFGIPEAFTSNYFTTQAIDYMQAKQKDKEPFFVYLPYNDAHEPNDTPPDARKGVSPHVATIENMDKNVGRIMKFLDDSGMASNTMVVFILGDNGIANFRLRGDKATSYEAGHRVPCVVRWADGGYGGTKATSRDIEGMITEMDLLPTFMDVLNLHDVTNRPARAVLAGRSVKMLLDTKTKNKDVAFGTRVLIVDNQRLDNLVKYKEACIMKDELDAAGSIKHKWRLMRTSATAPWELYDIKADLQQKKDLLANTATSGQYSTIIKLLQNAYEKWWTKVSANASDYARPIIGSPEEPSICLFGHDWHMDAGLPPWNQTLIAGGLKANGFNAVTFAKANDYTFDLRRWPSDIANETTVTSGLQNPLRTTISNALTYGKPLPIRSARIRVWNGNKTYSDERKDVVPESDGAVFTIKLPAGPAMVQTWFYDAEGQELCGAYYNYVSPKNTTAKP
ncbi:sulfatase-like hydrolase/transferase [Flavobacterium algicola]|uniref:sulfatase-like hydrolase/transferase n=1 Tax=Flavobacterium algicola TaxID=556529 RepID=UPI001EFE3644|nr:sulfatase-like hydrolase/transferase [Flavobacterium algicola]MCG9792353.1 sulfatase-like hydrolase/transferase [Flavobacterium algicola]